MQAAQPNIKSVTASTSQKRAKEAPQPNSQPRQAQQRKKEEKKQPHTYSTQQRQQQQRHAQHRHVAQGENRAGGSMRDELGCEHFDRCSGCTLNSDLVTPSVYARAREFFAQRGISDFILHAGDMHGWRRRAKLAVRGTARNPLLGLYGAGTHDVVPIPNCKAHHPLINEAVQLVKEVMLDLRVEPYNESTGSGSLRYIQLAVVHESAEAAVRARDEGLAVQLSLVWNCEPEDARGVDQLQAFAKELCARAGDRHDNGHGRVLHSVWANFNTSRANVILSPSWQLLAGAPSAWDTLFPPSPHPTHEQHDAAVSFAPGSFAQANSEEFRVLLGCLCEHVPPNSAVLDLYAGVGAIGLAVLAACQCRSVRCVERNPAAEDPFAQSRAALPQHLRQLITFHVGGAEESVEEYLADVDVVVVDPPRKGLGAELLSVLRRSSGQLHTLIYVSCGWEAFERDCDALIGDSAWRLETAMGFLFFPGTDSIETLAVFRR
eukprot:jgi/Chlat1/8343/Chrsp8S00676